MSLGPTSSMRARVSRAFDAVATSITRLVQTALSPLLMIVVAPVFAGSVVWFVRGGQGRLALLDTNKLKFEEQLAAFWPVLAAAGATLLVLLLIAAVLRFWRKTPFVDVAAAASAWLTPLAAVPFAVALFQKGIEKESPVLTLFFCAVVGAIVGISVYRLTRPTPPEPVSAPPRPRLDRAYEVLSWLFVLGMWAAYGWFFTRLAITNHHGMETRTIDLGLYDNIFYQSAHGRPLVCTFIKGGYHGSAHFDPILVLLSPLYRLYPRAEFLLGLQSIWIGSGVVPVFLIARSQLGSRALALMLAAVYALHPAVHGANMYEFHSLTLACVPLLWTLWALSTQRFRLYWVLLGVSLLVREDVPLMMSMVGVSCMLIPGGQLRRLGLGTILVCAIYFVIVKRFFMTSAGILMSGGAESYSFAYYYAELIPGGKAMGSMLLSLLTNPSFVLRHALEKEKLLFIATIFLPLVFAPFAARSWRLTMLYGIAFTTLATRTAVFSTHFQYTSSILPFAFFAAPVAIQAFGEGTLSRAYGLDAARLRRALVTAAFFVTLGVSLKFGGIVDNESFRGGFSRVVRSMNQKQRDRYEWMKKTVAMIPQDARVGVTNVVGPHVSNRKNVYFYGQESVDYVFIDDRELKDDRLKKHKKDVETGKLKELARHASFVLFEVVKKTGEKTGEKAEQKPEPKPNEDLKDVLGEPPKDE